MNTTLESDLGRFGLRELEGVSVGPLSDTNGGQGQPVTAQPSLSEQGSRENIHPFFLTNESEEPVTEGSTDSMLVQAVETHSISEEGEDNGRPAAFRSLVEHQAAFDQSILDRGVFGTHCGVVE